MNEDSAQSIGVVASNIVNVAMESNIDPPDFIIAMGIALHALLKLSTDPKPVPPDLVEKSMRFFYKGLKQGVDVVIMPYKEGEGNPNVQFYGIVDKNESIEMTGITFMNAALGDRSLEDMHIMKGGKGDKSQPIEVPIAALHHANLYFSWAQQTIGFGQASIGIKDGVVSADTEGMGKEWMRRACYAAIDTLIDALPPDVKK